MGAEVPAQSSLSDPRRQHEGGSASYPGASCSGKPPWCWERGLNKLFLGKLPVSINHGVREWWIWKSNTQDSILGKAAESSRKVKFRLLRGPAVLAQTHHDLRRFPCFRQLQLKGETAQVWLAETRSLPTGTGQPLSKQWRKTVSTKAAAWCSNAHIPVLRCKMMQFRISVLYRTSWGSSSVKAALWLHDPLWKLPAAQSHGICLTQVFLFHDLMLPKSWTLMIMGIRVYSKWFSLCCQRFSLCCLASSPWNCKEKWKRDGDRCGSSWRRIWILWVFTGESSSSGDAVSPCWARLLSF